jgi:hypothetical protein
MSAILLHSDAYPERVGRLSAKGVAAAAIVAASLGLSGLAAYWLMQPDSAAPPLPAVAAEPAPADSEPLISAPAPSCIDGRPASPGVSPESCL